MSHGIGNASVVPTVIVVLLDKGLHQEKRNPIVRTAMENCSPRGALPALSLLQASEEPALSRSRIATGIMTASSAQCADAHSLARVSLPTKAISSVPIAPSRSSCKFSILNEYNYNTNITSTTTIKTPNYPQARKRKKHQKGSSHCLKLNYTTIHGSNLMG